MINKLEFVQIGRVKKAFGKSGALRCQCIDPFAAILHEQAFIFIEIDGTKVPFEVASISPTPVLEIKFKDVTDAIAADSISGALLFLAEKDLPTDLLKPEQEKSDAHYGFLEGYELSDKQLGRVGKIQAVYSYPSQEMAFIEENGQETLIPLANAYITKIDDQQQEIIMDLPAGLLDLST